MEPTTLRIVVLLTFAVMSACATQSAGRSPNSGVATTRTPIAEYSDDVFQRLVNKYASQNGETVDYGAWQSSAEDMAALDEQVALIVTVSPDTHPALFTRKTDERRYWINTYNTLVLDAVLDYWPLDSVKASLTSRLIPGKGFFYDRDVVVGGKKTSLLKFEKEVLRNQEDPRLHFALNCASGSCPVLRPADWSEAELDRAAHDFVNDTANVRVEDGKVHLSEIFDWYEKDFPDDIYAYLRQFAEPNLAGQLATASQQKYPRRYRGYDWSLNDGSDADIFLNSGNSNER